MTPPLPPVFPGLISLDDGSYQIPPKRVPAPPSPPEGMSWVLFERPWDFVGFSKVGAIYLDPHSEKPEWHKLHSSVIPLAGWKYLKPIALANGIGVVPEGLPPLPPVPDGYDRWEYRGKGWVTEIPSMYSAISPFYEETEWHYPLFFESVGGSSLYHYIEAVKDLPAEPTESKTVTQTFGKRLGADGPKLEPIPSDPVENWTGPNKGEAIITPIGVAKGKPLISLISLMKVDPSEFEFHGPYYGKEEAKPEAADDEPIEVWNPLEHGIRNVPLMVPSHLHNKKVSRLERELAATNSENRNWKKEVQSVIDHLPSHCVVRVCEGGGPENYLATLAVSVANLSNELSQANAAVGELRSLLESVQQASVDPMGIEMAKVMGEVYRVLTTPPAPDGWREIGDNPPKDGTVVILNSCESSTIGHWEDSAGHPAGGPNYRNVWVDEASGYPISDVTHWMPLPKPPTGKEEA